MRDERSLMARLHRVHWALLLSTALAIATMSPALGANTVTQALIGGTLSASVANLALADVTYSHSSQTSSGTMTLTADDSTGTGQGWHVTIQSSAFLYSGSNSGSNIPAANFALTSAAAPVRTGGQEVDPLGVGGPRVPLVSPVGSLATARKTILAEPLFGQGTYTQALGVTLNIPGQSRAGTYTATLTTTISAGP